MNPLLTYCRDLLQGKTCSSKRRSPLWPSVRGDHVRANPRCAVCGGIKKVEVHHIKPFTLYPELELQPSNLLTLCEAKKGGVCCHLFFGHLGSYKRINPHAVTDAQVWVAKLAASKEAVRL